MKGYRSPVVRLALFLTTVLSLVAMGAFAQGTTGNIFGVVQTRDGAPIPGATATLTGPGAMQTFVTDAQGRFRFLNLSPGTYSVRAELAGLGAAVRSGIAVSIGRSADVSMQLTPAIGQAITVTAEAPLLDVRKTGTGATVTQLELEEVPTARDPWVILQQVPGVMIDRLNVGGNESGQQTIFAAKGANMFQSTFNIDGVNETDMIATGASAQYYDFSSLEEIQITTGGTDPRIQTPGAQINLVTKRGTNQWTGSGRYLLTDGEWQSEPRVAREAIEPVRYIGRPNEINEVTEWGVEVGGPVIPDRLWLWGAYADQEILNFVSQPPGATVRYNDDTILETLNAKVNAQLARNNSLVGTWNKNTKLKFGRNASPSRPPETTFNQSGFGPPGIYKLEDTHIFSPNFYVSGMYSKVNLGFQLQPQGSKNCVTGECARTLPPPVLGLAQGAWRNSFLSFSGLRPSEQYRLDASTFFETGAANHELKFGFGYRTAGNTSTFFWPQDHFIIDFTGLSGVPDGFGLTNFNLSYNPNYEYQYTDLYAGDVILLGNLTLHVGARFDQQESVFGNVSGPAHSIIPDLLPALTIPADLPETVEWSSISPRLGVTYALGEQRRTLLRAAYNRYVDHLGSNSGAAALQPYYRNAYFYTMDANRDDRITRDEILDFEDGPVDWFGFNPSDPGAILAGTTRIASGFEAPTTDEFILGVEHELLPQFTVGVSYSRREFDDFVVRRAEKTQGGGDWYTAADYVLDTANPRLTNGNATGTFPDGSSYSIPVFTLRDGVSRPTFFALTNRPGYSQSYDGLELTLTKRMANRWMLRGAVTLMDWKQSVGEDGFLNGDPTDFRLGTGSSGCSNCDGGLVAMPVGGISGAKGAVFINAEWQYTLNGVYQIPFIETNLGFSLTGRQGYPVLYGHAVRVTDGTTKTVLASADDVGDQRLEDILQVDLRLAKDFQFGPAGVQIAVDAFNITNENTILQRHPELITSTGALVPSANRVREQHSPRVFRVGARLRF
ncbi:MAG TPA: carboxypeptidase regulatory-like domain-containing protein [Thermoanaerobaculia bacterium]|nr:carboxypeptidase regulatory-like domain-containing protein [Thermoanaerobaculia bacterium]